MSTHILKIKQKSIYIVFLLLLLCGGLFTHAQFSADAFVVRTINVFPSQVSAVGWQNIETIGFQNLDEYALLQEFNSINSAVIDPRSFRQEITTPGNEESAQEDESGSVVGVDETTSTSTTQGVDDERSTSSPAIDFGLEEVSLPEILPTVEENNAQTQTTTTSAVSGSSPADERATTTVLREATSLFKLAVASVDALLDADESTAQEEVSEVSVSEEVFDTDENNDPQSDVTEPTVDEEEVVVTEEETTESLLDEADSTASDVRSTSSEDTTEEIGIDLTDGEAGASSEAEVVETSVAQCDGADCQKYVINLADFSFPLDPGVEISGAQFRLSFAAEKRASRDTVPMFTVEYSVGEVEEWNPTGVIVIDDQASNGYNGGYYLFALPDLQSQTELDSLKIRLVYQDDPTALRGLFVESAWLELFTLEAPEDKPATPFLEMLADDGFSETPLSGDVLELPTGEVVEFEFTDNNSNETLIIKSDKSTYAGLSEVTTYFSVTNTSNNSDTFTVQTYFPQNVGEVTDLQVFNQNKPRAAVIPEYRPYVYHCEAGWEYAGSYSVDSLQELSRQLSLPTEDGADNSNQSTQETEADVEFSVPTSSESEPALDLNGLDDTTTVSTLLPTATALMQFSATTSFDGNQEESASSTASFDAPEAEVSGYICRNTNVVRQCDELDGANTACRVENVKMADHTVTRYAGGWDDVDVQVGELPKPGFLKRVASFVGFGPKRKAVPDIFEARAHTQEAYDIAPGETVYFKMDIAFPAFSNGEYWIEAIGDREYGLLDPFWSSQWQYRTPIVIDNTTGTTDLTEYQVFLELDSSLTDFWSNVASDGSDIRFVQEVKKTNLAAETGPQFENTYNPAWADRLAITIPASNINSSLTSFPVYVNLADLGPDFWAGVASDGRDIRITQSDGKTELPYDLVEINTSAQTGELHFLANNLNDTVDNVFHIYFNNPSATAYAATDPYGSQAVWVRYEAVYHFSDNLSTIGNTAVDATGNGRDLVVEGAALATTTGKLGTAVDLTVTTTGILRDEDWGLVAGDDMVSSGWFQQGASSAEAIWQWGVTNSPQWVSFMPWYSGVTTNAQGYHWFGRTINTTWDRTPIVNRWTHFTTVSSNTINDPHLFYENNILRLSSTQNVTDPVNTQTGPGFGLQVGRYTTAGSYNGYIDELRFELDDSSRTPDWVAAEYLNHSTSTAFYATSTRLVGGETSINWYSTSWEKRQKLTIPDGILSGTQSDFPVYVDLSRLGADFWADVAPDGSDIRITKGDGVTELALEVVAINVGTKTGELYFKTDLRDGEDYYIYFDNDDASAYGRSALYGSDNVWSNGFQAVYHLQENGSGTGNPDLYKDSTANQYDGDDEIVATGKYGLFGAGQQFGLNSTDYINLPYQAMDGLTDSTVSWWHIASSSDDMTILSGANSTQFNEFWTRLDNSVNFFLYAQGGAEQFVLDNPTTYNNNTWQHFVATSQDDIDEMNLYVNGVGDTENPDPQPITALDIDAGGLIVGQDQDALGGNFSTTENFEGFLDELRIASVVRSAAWVAAEYENMANQSTFFATSSVETLTATDFVELDFWIQHFDNSAEEADIWVQVAELPAGEEAIIYVYYGNGAASSASDELATFSYSTSTAIYQVVDNGAPTQLSVVSLIDNNQVRLGAGSPVTLNQGERTTFTNPAAASMLSVLGPISGTLTKTTTNDGGDTIVPIAFASTSQIVATNRGTEVFYISAPFASTTVRTYIAGSGSAAQTLNIAKGAIGTAASSLSGAGQGVVFEASSPVMVMHRGGGGTAQDGLVAYPPTTRDLYGFISNTTGYISALTSGSDPSTFCSGGDTGSELGITRGEQQAISNCTGGTQFTGDSVRFTGQASPIVALQQADSDGNESTVFWAQHEMGTRYSVTNNTQFIAVACAPRFGAVTLDVINPSGTTVASGTCTPTATLPGRAYFGSNSGNTLSFTAGHQIVATNGVPFYAVYEDITIDGDEKNIVGTVQARKFDGQIRETFRFGQQEIANPTQYDQLSFRWYQNSSTSTNPTNSWLNGPGEPVIEGQVVNGAGALDVGDIIRLRINTQASNATATAGTQAFKLQYAAAASDQCTSADSWADVGDVGASGTAFNGYNNTGIADGTNLAVAKLTSTNVLATYEERNFSNFIPTQVVPGDVFEYDWVIAANEIDVNTNYCFRMVQSAGQEFESYTLYPQLQTVGPPATPTNLVFFDNENTAVLTPVLEFVATDASSDDIHYQVQIDNDYNFTSPALDRNSDDHFLEFENIIVPSDKAPYNSGNIVRFTATSALSPTTTYYWRVRASDPAGSATSSDWSTPFSFTTDTTVVVSEWLQTTGHQFATNDLTSLSTSTGAVTMVGSSAQMVSTPIDFDDATVGNAWNEVSWNDTETSGTILISVEYNDNGTWTLIPNTEIPGNDLGTSVSPINLLSLDTSEYNEIRLVANFSGTTLSLQDWKVSWGLRVETPVLGDLFDNQKTPSTLPVFDFVSSDPQGDDLVYEISFSTDYNFVTSSSTFNSSANAGFSNFTNGVDISPFTSGDTIRYTTQSALTNGVTYWWRVRAKDPAGGDSWSPWSEQDSFTVDTAVTLSTWFQTTRSQFRQGLLEGTTASSSGTVVVSDEIGEYANTTVSDGVWTKIDLQNTYQDPVVVVSVRYTPTADQPRSARVRNKEIDSFEVLVTNSANNLSGSTNIDYIVMEAGEWTIEDGGSGKRVIADTYENVSDVQASTYAASGYGQPVAFSPAFPSAPAIIGTISSNNDSGWAVVGLNASSTRDTPPTRYGFGIYLGRGIQTAVHAPEDVDYIVMQTGHGTNNGAEFDADFSADVHDEPPVTAEAFTAPFSSAPQTVLVQQAAEQGGQGGFAALYAATPPTTANYYPVIDEDVGADRAHATEPVLMIAFEFGAGTIKRASGGGLSGTIAGEDIIFSDGAGPKFGSFDWVDSTPGSSNILYQIQYQVSEGVYALVPDSQIPGNSVGTTTGPIDLTNVDINLYPIIRPLATLSCGGLNCPSLNEWKLEWSEGVNMSGTLHEYDRLTSVATGTIMAAVNGVPIGGSGTVSGGNWSIPNVTAFDGDIVTVWVDEATESEEAVAAFVYDGTGDITGVELFEQHLSISADEENPVTNALLGLYDNVASGDEDIFFNVDGSNNLVVCSVGSCTNANIYIGPGNVYIPSASPAVSVTTHDFVNDGSFELDANTFNVSGSWDNNATSSTDTATVNMTATSGSESITSSSSPLVFHNLSFGSGAGNATFTISANLDLSGNLTVASGTLDRSGKSINLAGSLLTGTAGVWYGSGTTTFDGAGGGKTWADNNPIKQKVGDVVIDGATTQVAITTSVAAYDVRIGANDTLSGGSGFTIYVGGDWRNSGTFNAQTSTVEITTDNRVYPPIVPGSADWYSDSNFTRRIPLIVDEDELTGNLSNFPVYVDLSTLGNTFWSNVTSNGRDIRVTASDGQTELPHDLVSINTSTKKGELHFLASSLSGTASTTFYIYFANPSAAAYAVTAPYGRNAVWADFEAVYHFNENPAAVSNALVDSSGKGRTLLVETAGQATSTGRMGQALNLPGTGLLRATGFTWPAGSPMTSTGWYKMTSAVNEALWQFGTGADPDQMYFEPWDNGTTRGQFQFGTGAGTTYDFSPRDTANWNHFMTIGATSTSQSNLVYHDKILRETQTQTIANPSNTNGTGLQIGQNGTAGFWVGQVDELRFTTKIRSTDWMTAEYSNQRTPTAFYATSTAQTYVPDLVIDQPTHNISVGASAFYNLTFNDPDINPAFLDAIVTVNNDVTIATGTVSFPTTRLSVGGSFLNTGGVFMHNNAELRMTATTPKTITLNGTEFLNQLYTVNFTGVGGSWTFTDANATTTNDMLISRGTVIFPSNSLAIGGTLTVTNTGVFNPNGGTVIFTSEDNETITPRTSSFNNVIFGLSDQATGWYNQAWRQRIAIRVASTSVVGEQTKFPIFVNLATLGNEFWTDVASDGADIRVTAGDGLTELPVEVVEINTAAKTGEIHFLAPSISASADTTFYIYVDNPAAKLPAVTSTYGRNAVWRGYEAVYHFNEDPAGVVTDMSGNGRDLFPTVGTPSTTVGILGTALDTTNVSSMLSDDDWTWTAGEDLISTGLYFMNNFDTGALWQFGSVCATDDCLAFMPWYDNATRGYHRFGETSGNDYNFTRDNSKWHHFTTIGRAANGASVDFFEDTILRDSYTQTGTGQNPSQTGLQIGRYVTNTYMDIDIDELRFATTTPSVDRIQTEYNNLTNVANFYSTSSEEYLDVVSSFTLNGSTADANGDVTIYYANLVAPSTLFTIGGSALNVGGSYNPNNATTTFDSNDTGETVDFGSAQFYNLSFSGAGGGWSISTTTVLNNLSLVTGASFTQNPKTTMTVSGRFSNSFSAAATTWTDSTLVLTGGDYTVTGKSSSGDDYGTVRVSGDSDLIIWNSTISTSSIRDTSSLYMPDFDGNNGELRIYGDYRRTSGSEYWSYDTDFDGTPLTGGSERPVTVKIGRGSNLYFATSTTLEVEGIAGATTTVSALSGIYLLQVNAGTLRVQNAEFQNIGPRGLYLTGGTAVPTMTSVGFAVAPGRSGITVDAQTVNVQPSSEFTKVYFSTTTANSIYEAAWADSVIITTDSSVIGEDLTDYPLYVDLSILGSEFWSGVRSDGGDIRVTTENGTELPIDLVEINTTAQTGELHVLLPTLQANQNVSYFIHFGNPAAVRYANSDEFGANAVWKNYEAVYHFNENPNTLVTDMTGNGRDLVSAVGTLATTTGQIGTALDTTASNALLQNSTWNWVAGEDLITSGLYFQSAFDTGALWQFGSCQTDNCIAFMPWYDTTTRGYHRFGETTGNDYNFTRNPAIWHHFTTIGRATDGQEVEIYEDNVLRDTYTQTPSGANPSRTGFQIGRYQTNIYMDIDVDELRIGSTTPSTNWIATEYRNLINPTSLYSTTSEQTLTSNVTTEGVPATFWLFSGGSGDLYGEAYDNDDGDPGSIQWDDSNFAVTISGVVYADDGVTPQTYPVCNGSTEVVTVVLDGTTTYTTSCDPIDGSYEISGISYSGEPAVTAYIESSAVTSQTNVALYDEVSGVGTIASNLMTVSRPDVVDGSVLVLISGKDDDTAYGAVPAGWTLLNTYGDATGDQIGTGIWYRVVASASGEPATYDFPIADNGEEFSYWMGTLLNVDTSTPVDVAGAWTKYQNANSVLNASSITTVTNGAMVFAAWYVDIDTEMVSPVYNWDTRAENIVSSGSNNLSVSSRLMTTAGPTGTSTVTGITINRDPHAGQFAFRPAVSPTASSSMVAAVVTKTPLGNSGSPYEVVSLRDAKTGIGTVAAAANIVVDRPAVENNDVLVMVIGKEDDFTVSAPSGWVLGADRVELTGNDMYSAIWYKVITNAGAEPSTYNFVSNDDTVEEFSYWIGSFRGVDTTNVFDVTPAWDNLQNVSTPAAASITTVTPGAYVIAGWYVIDDASMDMPGGVWKTLGQDLVQNSRLLAVAGRSMVTAGGTGAVAITGGSTDDVNVGQFALRPAAISVVSNITDMDIYRNRLILRHENIDPLTIADMVIFDNDDDSDLPFTATLGTPNLLTVESGVGATVWNNRTFSPGGQITLAGSGSTVQDGSLNLKTSGVLNAHSNSPISIGGSFTLGSGAVYNRASGTVNFTATNPGQKISAAASSTITFNAVNFTGAGGAWLLQTPIVSNNGINLAAGTLNGISNITVTSGSFTGNGLLDLTGGTTVIQRANTLGGVNPWTFNNLTLGNGVNSEITRRASNATTTVRNTLTIATAHFLNAYGSTWDIQGTGSSFIENGTLVEATSTIRYSGTAPNIRRTAYYNLIIDTNSGGSVTALAPTTGLQVLNNFRIGNSGTSTLNVNINDPAFSIGGNVIIGPRGSVLASDTQTLTALGSWDNNGVFTANGGTVTFAKVGGSATIAAGNSSFAKLNILGTAAYTVTENATATDATVLNGTGFTLQSGITLAVGGTFTNSMASANTTWTGSTLKLYSGTAYTINTKNNADTYNRIVVGPNTHPRIWNATTTTVVTDATGSLYSMNHQGVLGKLNIFGNFVSSAFNDDWSYLTDFDGAVLGVPRQAVVEVASGGSVRYTGGSLDVIGSPSATTTIGVAGGSGTYAMTIGGNTATQFNYYRVRNTPITGLVFTGSPTVTDLSYGDFEVAISGGTAMTVGGTVINANPAQEYTSVRLATTTAIAASNVTATGTSASAWRFVNVIGNLDGEEKDVDPGGDPGYLTWQDSAAVINISGNVYSDEGSSVSTVCDGTTPNIRLSVNGSTFASTTCDGDGLGGGTGAYTFTNINYGLGNTLTVYIDNETENAVAITQDPVSSITGFDLYENRIILKHESATALSIADMEVWDNDDDPGDLLFDAEVIGNDTLQIVADTKIIVWNNKKFTPNGNVTLAGSGSGNPYDGTLELRPGATFTAANGQSHSIGGSLIAGAGAVFTPAQSTTTFTTSGTGRTIDTNESGFYNLTFTGSGTWTMSDTNLLVAQSYSQSAGTVTLPSATTTIGRALNVTGGSVNTNSGMLYFTSTAAGNIVRLNNSAAADMRFNGAGGSWVMSDTNATATESFRITQGTVTLPSGTFTVGKDFISSGTVNNGGGTVILTSTTSGNKITMNAGSLNNLTIKAGAGNYAFTNNSTTLAGTLRIDTGTLTAGTGTLSVGGSFDASGGTFVANSGTVLFNSSATGRTVHPGNNVFYNAIFAGSGGGWTILENATTTNNFTLSLGSSFTVTPTKILSVGGVFTNTVGGTATNWNGATLKLTSGTNYLTNTKSTPVEYYENLIIGNNTDVRMWNSRATSTSVAASGSLYSQDHGAVDGSLYIYGDYHIPVTTDYWSRATDFDGAVLGVPRAVSVAIASSSTVTLDGGSLNMIGALNSTTTVSNQGTGRYAFIVQSGTLNANYYSFRNLDSSGLRLTGSSATLTSLNNGDFQQAANGTTLITLTSGTLNNNASLVVQNTRFDTGGFTPGVNISLNATTTNSWSITGPRGNLWGEAYDIDGTDDCSSIRWDDSQCLLTEQTTYRWRNDDGGEGAAIGTWYNSSWGARQRVRVINNDPKAYTDVAVKLTVPYDTDMQTDFDDLRFTDSTGITPVSYWTEKVDVGSEAVVWVKVPTIATSSVTELYMYYGNSTTTSLSDPSATFEIAEDFEDNNITEYSGNTTLFRTAGVFAYGGNYGLDVGTNNSARAADGIGRFDLTVSRGQMIRYMQYVDTAAGSADEVCTLFAVQSPVVNNNNYAVCIEQFGTDRISLVRNAQNTDTSGTLLSSKNVTYSTGWYEVLIDWKTNNVIEVELYTEAGALVATTSATDATYSSGGIGFTYWGQNGGWDSYVSWPRTDTLPTAILGSEQVEGGATWAGPQDTPVGGFAFGEVARLRIGVENTGLPITDQEFRLEFAPKLAAPSCEAVSSGSYTAVPPVASCGSSAVCMTSSPNVANGDDTTDHLVTDAGPFVSGKVVTNTANQSAAYDIAQNRYTELEYALTLTVNATNDAYCFRVTDAGALIDSYATLPELTLAFDPELGAISFNGGLDISLTPGTTTTVIASTTVTDYNGFGDLTYATTTFYKSTVTAACTPDNNNCYVASGSACTFTSCSGSSCVLSCSAEFQFHTEATDQDGGQFWYAFMEVEDAAGGKDNGTPPGIDVETLRALDVQNSIAYGTVDLNENTGTFNPSVSLVNLGNEAIDVEISGTDMTDGLVSVIPASQQLFATSTFDYAACASCLALDVVGVDVEVDLSKPTADTPPITDQIYWGIEVPFGTASNPHTGINTFTAISD